MNMNLYTIEVWTGEEEDKDFPSHQLEIHGEYNNPLHEVKELVKEDFDLLSNTDLTVYFYSAFEQIREYRVTETGRILNGIWYEGTLQFFPIGE